VQTTTTLVDDDVARIGLHISTPLVRDEDSYLCRPRPIVTPRLTAWPPADAHLKLRHIQSGGSFELPHVGVLNLEHVRKALQKVGVQLCTKLHALDDIHNRVVVQDIQLGKRRRLPGGGSSARHTTNLKFFFHKFTRLKTYVVSDK
jgi:hypothetical protein